MHCRLHLCPVELVSSGYPLPGEGHPRDWTAVAIPLKGTELVVISLYLTDGLGCTGINATKLAQLTSWLKLVRRPWVVFADWSATPPPSRSVNGLASSIWGS